MLLAEPGRTEHGRWFGMSCFSWCAAGRVSMEVSSVVSHGSQSHLPWLALSGALLLVLCRGMQTTPFKVLLFTYLFIFVT